MANFDNNSRTQDGNTTEIIGTGSDDTITISGTYLLSGTTDGVIDGGAGNDTLVLASSNLANTTLSGIEATEIANNGAQTVDAAQIENLGTITLTGSAVAFGGFVRLAGPSGGTADFSDLVLTGNQELAIQSNVFGAGDTITADFSGASVSGTAFIDYDGNTADDIVTGSTGDDEIDGSSGDDVLLGGAGADLLVGGSGDNDLQGGAGDDTLRSNTTSTGSLDGGADDDRIEVNGSFQGGEIDGGAGDDMLALTSANLTGTTIAGIEATEIANNGFQSIDAAQIENLGDITLTGNASAFGGFVLARNAAGSDVDLSNLTLAANEDFTFSFRELGVSDVAKVDFSTISLATGNTLTFNGTTGIDTVVGSDATDILRGQNVDTLSYESDTSGVTIDLRSDTASGGQAQGDTIFGFGNAIGGAGADLFVGDTGANRFEGGGGTDIAVFQGARADYTINVTGGTATVTDDNGSTNGFDGTDTTVGVEILRFSDQDVIVIAPNVPQVSIGGAPRLDEGDGGTTDFTFTLTRTGNLTDPSTVDFAVTGGTADAADFAGGTLPSG
ncbi:MAG: calcium-binding protein, partial [Litorimonas sp.]